MEYALYERNTTAPLLPHETHSPSPNRDEHGKHTRWISLRPDISLRQVVYCLVGLMSAVLCIAAIVGSVVGIKKYRHLAFPHRAVHASIAQSKDGQNVVGPYFGRAADGDEKEVRLVMTVWHREGIPFPPVNKNDAMDRWSQEYEQRSANARRWGSGGQGYIIPENDAQHQWETIWTGNMSGLTSVEDQRKDIVKIVLPGRVVHSLVMNEYSALVATFALIPVDHDTQSLSPVYNHTSSRPVQSYGPDQPWPLPFSSNPPPGQSELRSFYAHSAAGYTLQETIFEWDSSAPRQMGGAFSMGAEVSTTFLSSTTAIIVAHDYPRYDLAGFEGAMSALKGFKETCASDRYWERDCRRTFARDGHFENLLKIETPGKPTQWKYGPFITTRPALSVSPSYVQLPKQDDLRDLSPASVPEFSFDWHLSYWNLSPAKLSFLNERHEPSVWQTLHPSSHGAKSHDTAELYSSLLGMRFNDSRPLARSAVGLIARALRYLAIPLVLHYWATRRTSTGIAILTQTAQTVVYLVCYIVTTAVNLDDVPVFIFVVAILAFVVLLVKQLTLCFRPEFSVASRPISAGSEAHISVPTADALFVWWLRILIMFVTFAILRFAPAPPPIVSAKKYADVMHGFGGASHWNPTVIQVIHIFSAIQGSVWFGCQISQILLNYRQKTFAGSYALTAYVLLASQFLAHITQIFVNWFGRAQYMQPFTLWDVITLVVLAVTAVQAGTLPKVDQTNIDPVA